MSNKSDSGGSMIYIFEKRGGKFVEIGEDQGSIYFGARVNGYSALIPQSRAGGNKHMHRVDDYQHGKYVTVRLADYRMTGYDDHLSFVRERDPNVGEL